jgi:hypothetical protein
VHPLIRLAVCNNGCALALVSEIEARIDALTLWDARCGGVECAAGKSKSDFDTIRNRNAWNAFLAAYGWMQIGVTPSQAPGDEEWSQLKLSTHA